MNLSISEDKWFVLYKNFGYGNRITSIHYRIWNKSLIDAGKHMNHIQKTIERNQIVLRCLNCKAVGTVPADLQKTVRDRSVQVFEKEHKNCREVKREEVNL